MKTIRRLSYVALLVAFGQIVFGAIVRITGSGWGCGDHWPRCAGYWVPPLERPDLIIEVSHRYLALGVTLVTLALALTAWRRRDVIGVAGRGGPLRTALAAFAVVIATALLGAVTIKMRLNPIVIVLHLALAMTLLAAIILTGIRSGGFGARHAAPLGRDEGSVSGAAKSWRVARIGAILAFIVLVFGALTANLGAAGACLGFPTCRLYTGPDRALVHLQLTHRILAFLFAFHVLGAAMMIRKRVVAPVVKRAVWIALGAVIVQIVVAASLVELRLPRPLQSLHQAVGTLVWITVVIWAALAQRAAGADPATLRDGAPDPLPLDRDLASGTVRRAEPVTAGSALVVAAPAIDAGAIARLAEIERAARSYASAITALVAEADALGGSAEESRLVVTSEFEAVTKPEPEAPAEPAPVTEAPPEIVAVAEPEAIVAPDAEPGSQPGPADEPQSAPVVLPRHVVTPAQPMPAIDRPHSVAVIVARGADF